MYRFFWVSVYNQTILVSSGNADKFSILFKFCWYGHRLDLDLGLEYYVCIPVWHIFDFLLCRQAILIIFEKSV